MLGRFDFGDYLFYGRVLAAGPPLSLSGKDDIQLVRTLAGSY